MSGNYGDSNKFKPSNKEKEIDLAVRFQKKLFFSKIFYYYIALLGLLSFLEKYHFISEESLSDQLWLLLAVLFVILGLYSIISTIILGICPYCQSFQKLNGKAIGINSNSITHAKGVSPFIKYCARCNAPLSEKAVKEVYEKLEKENSSP